MGNAYHDNLLCKDQKSRLAMTNRLFFCFDQSLAMLFVHGISGGGQFRPVGNHVRALQGLLIPFVARLTSGLWRILMKRAQPILGILLAQWYQIVIVHLLNHANPQTCSAPLWRNLFSVVECP